MKQTPVHLASSPLEHRNKQETLKSPATIISSDLKKIPSPKSPCDPSRLSGNRTSILFLFPRRCDDKFIVALAAIFTPSRSLFALTPHPSVPVPPTLLVRSGPQPRAAADRKPPPTQRSSRPTKNTSLVPSIFGTVQTSAVRLSPPPSSGLALLTSACRVRPVTPLTREFLASFLSAQKHLSPSTLLL